MMLIDMFTSFFIFFIRLNIKSLIGMAYEIVYYELNFNTIPIKCNCYRNYSEFYIKIFSLTVSKDNHVYVDV